MGGAGQASVCSRSQEGGGRPQVPPGKNCLRSYQGPFIPPLNFPSTDQKMPQWPEYFCTLALKDVPSSLARKTQGWCWNGVAAETADPVKAAQAAQS